MDVTPVAIVSVTYRAAGFVRRFLDSVRPLLDGSDRFRLVVVDNASGDGTVDVVRAFIDAHGLADRAHLLAEDENRGFGTGCNVGARFARELGARSYWFVNPDAAVDRASAEALVRALENRPDVAFVGGLLRDDAGNTRAGAFRFPTIPNVLSSNLRSGVFDRAFPWATTAYREDELDGPVDWLSGASFLARANVFDALGGFDEAYFLYFEEVDLFYRARELGHRAVCVSDCAIYHDAGASTGVNRGGDLQKRRPSYWYESRRRFYLKNFGPAYFALVDALTVGSHATWVLTKLLRGQARHTPRRYTADVLSHSLLGRPR